MYIIVYVTVLLLVLAYYIYNPFKNAFSIHILFVGFRLLVPAKLCGSILMGHRIGSVCGQYLQGHPFDFEKKRKLKYWL